MKIRTDELERITDGTLINGESDFIINKISRKTIEDNPKYFFVPIRKLNDIQSKILECVQNGIIGFLIEKTYDKKKEVIKKAIEINPKIIIIEVANIRTSYKNIGCYYRNRNDKKTVIGITGSVGKTSLKEMLTSVVKEAENVLSTEGEDNILLCHCDLMTKLEEYDSGILEAGIAGKNIMGEMSKILSPTIAIITNIGNTHLERLNTKEEVLKEKLKICLYMRGQRAVFLNKDDEYLKKVKLDNTYDVHWYSTNEAKKVKANGNKILFETELYGKKEEFQINTYGLFNVSNAICAIRVAEFLRISAKKIKKGLENYVPPKRRMERIDINGYTIFDDASNSSYLALKEGLKTIDSLKEFKRKIAVLGDMLELGKEADPLHEKIGEEFENLKIDILLTQGEYSKKLYTTAKKYFKDKIIKHFETKKELIEYLKSIILQGDVIYIKASSGMEFKKIVEELEK